MIDYAGPALTIPCSGDDIEIFSTQFVSVLTVCLTCVVCGGTFSAQNIILERR